jgi:hypothetical protein
MYGSTNTGRRTTKWMAAVSLVAAGAITGGVLASTLSASATSTAKLSGERFQEAGRRHAQDESKRA